MTVVTSSLSSNTFDLNEQAQLLLRVGAPRLAARADEVQHAMHELAHVPIAQRSLQLGEIPGLEALAVLAAVPPERREAALAAADLAPADEQRIAALAHDLGYATDDSSWAAALANMFPGLVDAGVPFTDETIGPVEAEDPESSASPSYSLDVKIQPYFILSRVPIALRGTYQDALLSRFDAVREAMQDIRAQFVDRQKFARELAFADLIEAWITAIRGDPAAALRILREQVLPVADRLGDDWLRAQAMDIIGDVLFQQGEFDQSLRIREEQLPVFQRHGDERMVAVTKGGIADILQARGQLAEALRIHREETLPVLERLGDVRAAAVIKDRIADILQARGQFAEALRNRESVLSIFERLGDARELAMTKGKIAEILAAQGQLDAAQCLLNDEVLPAFERLGDVRGAAVTKGKIADILQLRGELDNALRVRGDDELPIYERLGDVRSVAGTKGKIADILQSRGQRDEVLRIYREEVLPTFERLGDIRNAAMAKGKIADIFQDRGQHDEALRIRREDVLPVFDRLGAVHDALVQKIWIASCLRDRNAPGDAKEAKQLLEEALVVAKQLQIPDAEIIREWLAED